MIRTHETKLKEFCEQNGYDFAKLLKFPRGENESFLYFVIPQGKPSDEGLLDETPAEILLSMEVGEDGSYKFAKGERADELLHTRGREE